MKFSTTLALALAPLAMARKVRNAYPGHPMRRTPNQHGGMEGIDIFTEGDDSKDGGDSKGDNSKGYDGYSANSRTEIIIIWANPGGGAATTTVNEKVTVTQTVTAGAGAASTELAAAASHTVTVGGPAGLVFQPDQLNEVPVGDTVVFEFLSQNHTVTQSPFDTPCLAMEGGMDSGFMANPNNTVSPPPQIAMQVMSDKPLWFYCKQGNHCGTGMVFSVNPTAEKTQAMFQQLAIAQNGTGDSTPITGGSTTSAAATTVATEAATATTVDSGAQESGAAGGDAGGDGSVAPGSGTVNGDGSCSCFVSCSAGSFPAADSQGIGARGGVPGGLPMNMAIS